MRRRSAQQKLSLIWAALRTAASGGTPFSHRSSRAPLSSVMYFLRISRFCLWSGSFVLSQSSMRPLRSSISAIQWTLCAVIMMMTSPFWCRPLRDVMPSMLPRRNRKMSEPRPPSIGRQPPMTMSASSMNTIAGAAACAAAKTLMMSACSIISPTRKNLPCMRWASQRPTVVLPVPGFPWMRTPRFGARPRLAARSGFSSGKRTCFSSSSFMPSSPGYLARSTASTSSGATAALLTSSVRMAVKTFSVSTPPAEAAWAATRPISATSSAGESCECRLKRAASSTFTPVRLRMTVP
mmetsp:Transcript_57476/g.168789  ORF Transcript_57476/g.168789 Transcript_57476/m.168789 type:complete len:295 (+) Transcript_57476:149-1033(+)